MLLAAFSLLMVHHRKNKWWAQKLVTKNQWYLKNYCTDTTGTLILSQDSSLSVYNSNHHEHKNYWSKGNGNFFIAMGPPKAHWYNWMVPSVLDPSRWEIILYFPHYHHYWLKKWGQWQKYCKSVVAWRKGDIFEPKKWAWDDFIAEHKVVIEVTIFSVDNKHWYFVRIGSFNALRHPMKISISCWRGRLNIESF